MTGVVIIVVAAVAIGYAAWYEARLGRAERGDREFARRHAAVPTRRVVRLDADRDARRINQVRRDPSPSPRRLGDYEARAVAEGEMQS